MPKTSGKLPPEISPTHEWQFTRLVVMHYNSVHHVTRVTYGGKVVQDWAPPSIEIDLNKFELMPVPPKSLNALRIEEQVRKLQSKGNLPKIMSKWKQRLPVDQYAELLDDLRSAIIASEHEMLYEIKNTGERPDLKLIHIISRFE